MAHEETDAGHGRATPQRPMTTEYGVYLTVTSAYGVHQGTGHHTCWSWTPEPTSVEEAREKFKGEHGVVEVHDDVLTREVPAPEGWFDDE